jgi:hypothetical protein
MLATDPHNLRPEVFESQCEMVFTLLLRHQNRPRKPAFQPADDHVVTDDLRRVREKHPIEVIPDDVDPLGPQPFRHHPVLLRRHVTQQDRVAELDGSRYSWETDAGTTWRISTRRYRPFAIKASTNPMLARSRKNAMARVL